MKRWTLPITLIAIAAMAIITVSFWPRTVIGHGDYPYYESVEAEAGRADAVIVGQVESTATHRDSGANLVVTDASVKVVESLKGPGLPAVVTVQQMGGTIGNVKYLERGATPMAKGQTLLLFLAKLQNGKYMALNPSQGSLVLGSDQTVLFNGSKMPLATMKDRVRNAADTRTPAQKKEAGE